MASPFKSVPLGAPGAKYANSPRTDKLEGTSVSIFGSLLTKRVKNGSSVEKFPFIPKMVLLMDSEL